MKDKFYLGRRLVDNQVIVFSFDGLHSAAVKIQSKLTHAEQARVRRALDRIRGGEFDSLKDAVECLRDQANVFFNWMEV